MLLGARTPGLATGLLRGSWPHCEERGRYSALLGLLLRRALVGLQVPSSTSSSSSVVVSTSPGGRSACWVTRAPGLILGARTVVGAHGLTLVLLLVTRSKDATRGSWPYY